MKALHDMTLEELWQLFPIVLEPYNPEWKVWYEDARQKLLQVIPTDSLVAIHHIGSTAVPCIWAKPIVDILVELKPTADIYDVATKIENSGWIRMSESPRRISLNKGYTPDGYAERVFHLHMRFEGDNAEVAFAGYLRKHHDVAKEYEQLKLSLWHKYEHNRDGYTEAKTEFIKQVIKKIMEEPKVNAHNKEEHRPSHTAEHLLNQVMVRMFGCERSKNAHIERKKSKINYNLNEAPTPTQIEEIEARMNELIQQDLPVTYEYVTRDNIPEGVKLDKLPEDASETLRIVRIGDFDICPCIGQHVASTKEIGFFHITSTSYIDGSFRIVYKVKSE